MTFLLIIFSIIIIGCIILIYNSDSIQQERCEEFRQEKLKEGWSEELINIELLSNDFMV
jgi:hypothetical protein